MKLKRFLFFLISLLLFSINVYAESSIDVNKRLNGVDNPDVIFSYEIEPKETNPDSSNLNPNTFDISFDDNSTITDRLSTSSHTLDFSTINYTKPGKYEYIVRETSSSNQSIYPKDDNYYIIVVNVLNEVDDNNNPTGEFIIDVMQSAFLNNTSGKGDILFETSPLTYITISKTVTGDMGDINEYFKFRIELDGDGYTISGQDSSVVYNGEVINTINTYNESEENYVYLKHGQSITIGLNNGEYELPSNLLYKIEEMDATNYKTYVNNNNNDSKSWITFALNTPQSNTISYVNNLESTVLTGVFVSILPYALMICVSIIGIYVIKKKSKKTNIN